MELIDIEVWVMVNGDGEFEVSKDAEELQAPAGQASRLVKITVKVPLPQPVELEAEIGAEPETGELKLA
ncbi:hypothetical protein J8F10_14455 [Gemmata sp. G18]|uniref:Uncharacterized protein n=1 Tax=Gemmata palustris TaxID=2822762 RepID=A0ABS5BRZ9_9BACT|nr:hypothetical protein [Gemmata palustris]MBP3956479.1 hypothetical protein [Gemmata palustris]